MKTFMQATDIRKKIIIGHQRNAIKNHIEIPSHTSQNGDHEKGQEKTDARENAEKQKHFYTVDGNVHQFKHCGRQCGDS